jgi:Kef-type K+ transport system membrane component KefB
MSTSRASASTTTNTGGMFTGRSALSTNVAQVLLQIVLVGATSRGLAILGKRLRVKQPMVIYEILGGIVLGPSLLGTIIPGFSDVLFPDIQFLNVIANIGLVVYMFLIGIEVDFRDLKHNFKRSAVISALGIIVPLLLGVGMSFLLYQKMQDDKTVHFPSFALFIGVAMSITVRCIEVL